MRTLEQIAKELDNYAVASRADLRAIAEELRELREIDRRKSS